MAATIYLIPTFLYDDAAALQCLPVYINEAIKKCFVFYVENERTARRFLKKMNKEIVIDNYEWHSIHKTEQDIASIFKTDLSQQKTIGIISESGCPGIADPGQILINIAQQNNAHLVPLVGPNSIILALMASGMNGQCFQFNGYLPVDAHERKKKLVELEAESRKKNCTQIFIETPYRNNQILNDILSTARSETLLCIGIDITSMNEYIKTKKIKNWRKENLNLHKHQAIFLLYAGGDY